MMVVGYAIPWSVVDAAREDVGASKRIEIGDVVVCSSSTDGGREVM